MNREAPSATIHLCPVCGAPGRPNELCDFDRPEDASPAHGDYDAMHQGLMTHAEHLLVVARWFMHNPPLQGPAVRERYGSVVRAAWGRPQTLFPLRT